MANLFRHIEFLLLNHDCVIVPGLGAFIATASPARIEHTTNRILPPCRYVMFNQAVTLDDGLLANSYARKLSLSFEEARQVILRDVAELHQQLHKMEPVKIGRLGTLSLGEEEQLLFTPADTPEHTAHMIGMATVNLADLKNVSQKKNLVSPLTETRDGSHERPYFQFRIHKTALRITAAVTIVLAVALAVIMYPVPHDSREQRASVMPVEALIPIAKKQIATTIASDTNITNVAAESKAILKAASDEVKSQPTYYLIVATFKSMAEAERFAASNSTPDFPLTAVASRKVARVSVASSVNKQKMIQKLSSPDISKRFPNAWIWTSPE